MISLILPYFISIALYAIIISKSNENFKFLSYLVFTFRFQFLTYSQMASATSGPSDLPTPTPSSVDAAFSSLGQSSTLTMPLNDLAPSAAPNQIKTPTPLLPLSNSPTTSGRPSPQKQNSGQQQFPLCILTPCTNSHAFEERRWEYLFKIYCK